MLLKTNFSLRVLLTFTLLAGLLGTSLAQVTGTVTSADGETIPGVTVLEKGNPNNGIITDVDGKFKPEVSANSTLIHLYLGCQAPIQ